MPQRRISCYELRSVVADDAWCGVGKFLSSPLDELSRLLSPDGELFIQTDVEERAMTYRNILEQHPAFVVQGEGGFIAHNPFGARSNREVRAEQNVPIWRILATKRASHSTVTTRTG